MKDKIKNFINTKQFHISFIAFIIFIIIFVVSLIVLKYNVEGDGNLPFVLSKMSIISNIEGIDIQDDTENKWNINVNQNNDIYLYIRKSENYNQTDAIQNIVIDNFKIEKKPNVGEIKIFKADNSSEKLIFKNTEENEVETIEFKGDLDANIKEQKISNQGGIITFRCSITNIGNYISNEDEEINHDELLSKLSINNEDLKFKISFDISINLTSGKQYKATANLEIPINDVVNNGVQSIEKTELEDIVFKRI